MIYEKYLYKSTLKPLFYGVLGCTFLILIDHLSEMIENIIVRGVPFLQVVELLSYHTIYLLSFTIPMGMMIGSLIAYGNMADTNEVTAMKSLGIDLKSIVKPVILSGLFTTLLILFINQFITPLANIRQKDVIKKLAYDRPSFGLGAKQFITNIEGYSIYLDSFDYSTDTSGKFILFANSGYNNFYSVVLGERARWDNGYMKIEDAIAYEMDRDGKKQASANFSEQSIPIRNKISGLDFGIQGEEDHMSLTALIYSIINRRKQNFSTISYELALQTKLALAISPFILAILGALLASGSHKRFRKSDGKIMGILILFIYWIWIIASRGIIINLNVSSFFIWIPNIIFAFISFLLFMYKRNLG